MLHTNANILVLEYEYLSQRSYMVGMRSDTRASTNSCQPLLDVSAGQTQTDPVLQDSKMTQRGLPLSYGLLLVSSQRLLLEK